MSVSFDWDFSGESAASGRPGGVTPPPGWRGRWQRRAILSIILAKKKHRPALMWFLLTLPFGVVALFVLLALPAVEEESG